MEKMPKNTVISEYRGNSPAAPMDEREAQYLEQRVSEEIEKLNREVRGGVGGRKGRLERVKAVEGYLELLDLLQWFREDYAVTSKFKFRKKGDESDKKNLRVKQNELDTYSEVENASFFDDKDDGFSLDCTKAALFNAISNMTIEDSSNQRLKRSINRIAEKFYKSRRFNDNLNRLSKLRKSLNHKKPSTVKPKVSSTHSSNYLSGCLIDPQNLHKEIKDNIYTRSIKNRLLRSTEWLPTRSTIPTKILRIEENEIPKTEVVFPKNLQRLGRNINEFRSMITDCQSVLGACNLVELRRSLEYAFPPTKGLSAKTELADIRFKQPVLSKRRRFTGKQSLVKRLQAKYSQKYKDKHLREMAPSVSQKRIQNVKSKVKWAIKRSRSAENDWVKRELNNVTNSWNKNIGNNEGNKYVQSLSQLKTSCGKEKISLRSNSNAIQRRFKAIKTILNVHNGRLMTRNEKEDISIARALNNI